MRTTLNALLTLVVVVSSLPAQVPGESDALDQLLQDGKNAMYRLQYPRARDIFGQIISQYPESPIGYGMMQNVTFNEMLLAAANPALHDYGAPSPYSSTKIYKSIEAESQRFDEATDRLIEITDAILEEDEGNVEALYFRGLAEENLAAEAIVIERSRTSAMSHGISAKDTHRDVLRLDPDFIDAQVSVAAYEYVLATLPLMAKFITKPLGWLGLMSGGDKDEAFEMMEEVGRAGRYRDVDAQVLLTVMHAAEGDPHRAVEIFESMSARYPESYLVDLNLAGILERKLDDPDAALDVYQRLLESLSEKTPGLGEGEVHFRMGKTYLGMKDYDEARAAFERAIESPTEELETDPLSYFYLGQIQEELDLDEESEESYRQFLGLASSMESLEEEIETANEKLH